MSKKRIEMTLEELSKSIRSRLARPYDKRIIHEKTGLEFYVQSKERYGDWFTLSCVGEFQLKWSGHYTEIRKAFYLEKKD